MSIIKPKLSKELFDTLSITSKSFQWKIIEIIPQYSNEAEYPFETHEEGMVLSIGLTKKTYLSIFKEAHTYWHSALVTYQPNLESSLNEFTLDELWNVYYTSLGYLITTNENNTLIRLHEVVLSKLMKRLDDPEKLLEQEFELLTVFVNSKLKKINKSSSLWFLIKKLTIMIIFAKVPFNFDKYETLIKRIVKSIDLHFANYYSSTFLQWLIRLNHNILSTSSTKESQDAIRKINVSIIDALTKQAHERVSDVSVWTSIEVYLKVNLSIENSNELAYVIEELNYLVDDINELHDRNICKFPEFDAKVEVNPCEIVDQLMQYIFEQLTWLIKINCSIPTPYRCLVEPILKMNEDNANRSKQILSEFKKDKDQELNAAEIDSESYYKIRPLCIALDKLCKI